MLDDKIFMEKYGKLIVLGCFKMILSEDEEFLLQTNCNLITHSSNENIEERLKKIRELFKKRFSKALHNSTIISAFRSIYPHLDRIIDYYGENGLIQLKNTHEFDTQYNSLNKEGAIKIILKYDLKMDGEIKYEVERIKKQISIFGEKATFMKIEDLGLDSRIIAKLKRRKMNTVADICERKKEDFYRINGLGDLSVRQIDYCIHSHKFFFLDEMQKSDENRTLEELDTDNKQLRELIANLEINVSYNEILAGEKQELLARKDYLQKQLELIKMALVKNDEALEKLQKNIEKDDKNEKRK